MPNRTEKYEIILKILKYFNSELINNNTVENDLDKCFTWKSIEIKFIEYLRKNIKIEYLINFLDRNYLNKYEYYKRWICIKNYINLKNNIKLLKDDFNEERCILNETKYSLNFFTHPISSYYELSLSRYFSG